MSGEHTPGPWNYTELERLRAEKTELIGALKDALALSPTWDGETTESAIGKARAVLAKVTATGSKRPVAFRAPNGKGGWVVTQDEQEAIDVAGDAEYQGLYVRDGT